MYHLKDFQIEQKRKTQQCADYEKHISNIKIQVESKKMEKSWINYISIKVYFRENNTREKGSLSTKIIGSFY